MGRPFAKSPQSPCVWELWATAARPRSGFAVVLPALERTCAKKTIPRKRSWRGHRGVTVQPAVTVGRCFDMFWHVLTCVWFQYFPWFSMGWWSPHSAHSQGDHLWGLPEAGSFASVTARTQKWREVKQTWLVVQVSTRDTSQNLWNQPAIDRDDVFPWHLCCSIDVPLNPPLRSKLPFPTSQAMLCNTRQPSPLEAYAKSVHDEGFRAWESWL